MVKSKYFKVHVFGSSISIDENELPKAIEAQITGKVVMLRNGAVRGNSITFIEPDFHKAMGFNEGYKLTAEDHAYIRRDCADYDGYIGSVKDKVHAMISGQSQNLLK